MAPVHTRRLHAPSPPTAAHKLLILDTDLILYYYRTCTIKYHESSRHVLHECRRHECNTVTSGILPYAFDNVFIICLCVKRNADSAVRCSSKSLGQGRIEQCTRRESYCRRLTVVLPSQATPLIPQLIQKLSWSFL